MSWFRFTFRSSNGRRDKNAQMPARSPLGDSHNFGRRVVSRGARIEKPRSLFWEWLILGKESPLRTLLAREAAHHPIGKGAFDFLPSLRFKHPEAIEGGTVERIELAEIGRMRKGESRILARVVGRAIALFSWLGVSDLHWENVVIGRSKRGELLFAPIDIEMILADLPLPTATKLIPDADPEYAAMSRHSAGVRRALPFLGKPIDPTDLAAMASAYDATLSFLDNSASAISDVFSSLPFTEAPIRICLRSTEEYVRPPASLWPPFLKEETAQMVRGDVPYFFRLYGKKGIRYFADPSLRTTKMLPLKGDTPQPDPILSVARQLRSPSRAMLRNQGLFTLLGAFDHRSYRGRHAAGEMAITFTRNSFVLTSPNGEIEAPRDLRKIVGSVYLPCSCGEVRSVFVPQVTRCRNFDTLEKP